MLEPRAIHYRLHIYATVTLLLIPFALRGQKMIGVLWLEASTPNEFATIELVDLVRAILLVKNLLDVMIPLVAGVLHPDPLHADCSCSKRARRRPKCDFGHVLLLPIPAPARGVQNNPICTPLVYVSSCHRK